MDGIDHLGVLGHYRGVAVHDGWATYRKYRRPTHALCNVHHLRELQGAIERDPHTQTWAQQMDELLRELKDTVERAKARGESAPEAGTLEAYPRRYEQVIALGHRQNPPPTQRTGKRGPIGRSMTANLHRRLDEHRDEVLLFAHDFRVPFDNNLAERDLRMIKLQQKISGSWRTITGAQRFRAALLHQHHPQARARPPRRASPDRRPKPMAPRGRRNLRRAGPEQSRISRVFPPTPHPVPVGARCRRWRTGGASATCRRAHEGRHGGGRIRTCEGRANAFTAHPL